MYWTIRMLLLPGPPPLSAWIMANSFIAPMVESRITMNDVGAKQRQNDVTEPLPARGAVDGCRL